MTRPHPQFPSPADTPLFERVESDGTRVLVMMPDLDTLLGVLGFSRSDAIVLKGYTPPVDGWTLFGRGRAQRAVTLH
ncbi:hypothetical protein [Blastochloris viridis]|uniref:Uncharacterized protein n=1 Tax=Blastochloris viridis TaxID=1079 RepID=A0A0H5B7H1_BLAVI|nr:hypothetical protein [Blastochloris viridis]ALK08592.1 hypothetical protein BVIR_799 [Blastochloris viridis]BAR98120.1 hypothetical protein BV133_527 [Blastochloris viridis]CUU41255.1 hypothetical protein BVIRIDIS_02440 [Blastochloris viridis]